MGSFETAQNLNDGSYGGEGGKGRGRFKKTILYLTLRFTYAVDIFLNNNLHNNMTYHIFFILTALR